jgi:hypothetical protein
MAIRGEEQSDETAHAHTANADDFDGDVLQAIAVEQDAHRVGKRQAIDVNCLARSIKGAFLVDMEEDRWLVEQAAPSPDLFADPGEEVFADALARPRGKFLLSLSRLGVRRHRDQPLLIQSVVPDLQRAHLRIVAQVFPVSAYAIDGGGAGLRISVAIVAAGHCKADGQALDVPFPGRR